MENPDEAKETLRIYALLQEGKITPAEAAEQLTELERNRSWLERFLTRLMKR